VKIWQEVEGAVGYIFMYLFISFARRLRVGDRGATFDGFIVFII
jgi:hypothetical protein